MDNSVIFAWGRQQVKLIIIPATEKTCILIRTVQRSLGRKSLDQAFGRSVDFQDTLNDFPRCRPKVNVAIRSNRGAHVLGIPDNLHLAKVLTVIS